MSETNVLVVDDDRDTFSNLSDILGEFGYDVDVAYRGQDALDLLKQRLHPLVLLDYRLPCMTGVQLFERMRQILESVEGLLITGYVSNETESQALLVGFRHVIPKPVDVPKLMELIGEALAGYALCIVHCGKEQN